MQMTVATRPTVSGADTSSGRYADWRFTPLSNWFLPRYVDGRPPRVASSETLQHLG
jgi:hypothetical protein